MSISKEILARPKSNEGEWISLLCLGAGVEVGESDCCSRSGVVSAGLSDASMVIALGFKSLITTVVDNEHWNLKRKKNL